MSLRSGLAFSLELDEDSGDAIDALASNTCSLHGTSGSAAGPGGAGKARTFDGSSTYFSHVDDDTLRTGDVDLTLEFWAYADDLSGSGGLPTVAKKGNDSHTTVDDEWIVFHSGGYFVFGMSVGTDFHSILATAFGAIATGTWYHVVCKRDVAAGTIGISVDGVESLASIPAGVNAGTLPLEVGASSSQGLYWHGRIARARMWKGRVLTSGEVSALYNGGLGLTYAQLGGGASGRPGFRTPLLGHSPLISGSD